MPLPPRSLYGLLLAAAALCAVGAWRAQAHPHVWISVETTVLYENGAFVGLKHRWTFDEFYSSMEVEGLDKNKDGKLDREELSELAGFYVSGLKDYSYFTFPALAGKKLNIGDPSDVWLEYKESLLSLNFTVPFAQPVLAEARGFAFSVYDPSFYIALDIDKANSMRFAEGTPKACKLSIDVQARDSANTAALSEAFSAQFGAMAGGPAKAVSVECPIVLASAADRAGQDKQAASKPVESKPVEKPAEIKPVEIKPVQSGAKEDAPTEKKKPDVVASVVLPPILEPAGSLQQPAAAKKAEPAKQKAAMTRAKKQAKVYRKQAAAKRRVKHAGTSWWGYSCTPQRLYSRSRSVNRW